MYINNIKKAIVCCGNLVFVNKTYYIVHFTYRSVKQYLLLNVVPESLNKHFINLKKANKDTSAVCIINLNLLALINKLRAQLTTELALLA